MGNRRCGRVAAWRRNDMDDAWCLVRVMHYLVNHRRHRWDQESPHTPHGLCAWAIWMRFHEVNALMRMHAMLSWACMVPRKAEEKEAR